MTTPYLLIYRKFFLVHKVILYYCFELQRLPISKATFKLLIRKKKWHVLSIMSTHFSTDISVIFSGLNLAHMLEVTGYLK